MKKIIILLLTVCFSLQMSAQTNLNYLQLSLGALYERGLEANIAISHETRYHNAWEFFASYYLKYEKDENAGHITKESFWHSYNTWCGGAAYKPCVVRGRNKHGNLRIGAFLGSDLDKVIGGGTLGYEHSYALRHGFEFFWKIKEDIVIGGKDAFRTGAELGLKIPL